MNTFAPRRFNLQKLVAFCALMLLGLGVTKVAQAVDIDFTVDALKVDRKDAPVRVPVKGNLKFSDMHTATVETDDGKTLLAQITKPSLLSKPGDDTNAELVFILPELKAGKTAHFVGHITVGGNDQNINKFHWNDTQGKYSELQHGDRPVLRYMYEKLDTSNAARREETIKPFHHVYDPTGKQIITKGAGGKFTHHRGLFFGFNKVTYGENQAADVWHCKNGESQQHASFIAKEEGPVLGRHRVAIEWRGKKDDVFAQEEREMTAYNTPGGTLIEFATRVRPVKGEVKLDGDPQHAGFHFRAHGDVSDKTAKQTYYLRTDGQGKPGETRNWPGQKEHVDLDWNAMSFMLDGQRYTVGYLDRPENPKQARFSERDYGRFGSYFEYKMTEEKPLELNYRVWVQAGETTGEQMAARDANFDEPVKVTLGK